MRTHTKFGVRENFFQELRAGSRVKQQIVLDYFIAYNRVMARGSRKKVGYADLFAGPGLYKDQNGKTHKSIPILLCETAVETELFRQKVHMWFNEADTGNFEQLREAVQVIPQIESLHYQPTIQNKIVTADWAAKLRKLPVPTLVFLDPCGYKGLSLNLVSSVLEGFGNDCIFFFNYSRINMKLSLEVMNASIDEFFEPERARALRGAIESKNPAEREEIILDAVENSIKQVRAIPLKFRFKSENGRISHHLIYASKNTRAAGMMKRILNSVSTSIREGVGSNEHDPRSQPAAASLFTGLYAVEERLLSVFEGREIQFGTLLEEEADIRFTDTNYRDALLKLEAEGRVEASPSAELRPWQAGGNKRTLSKSVWLKFKGRSEHGK